MAKLGIAASLVKLTTMWMSPKEITECTMLRSVVRNIVCSGNTEREKILRKYMHKHATIRQGEITLEKLDKLVGKLKEPGISADKHAEIQHQIAIFQKTPDPPAPKKKAYQELRIKVENLIGEAGLKQLDAQVNDVIDAV
jgi:hypothetical protein